MANEDRWRQFAKQTSRKINCGWWLQTLATPLLIISLLIACTILIMRRELDSLPVMQLTLGSIITLAITGIACWLVARRLFESNQQSLVRIESAMRLRNALTAADQGVTQWPQVPTIVSDGVQWHWNRLLFPVIISALIISCGLMIPIQAKSQITPPQQPIAWNELDTSLDQLDQQKIVQEEYLDAMRKKLEKLREQSPDDWFSHSSLEATDHLQQNHQTEQENLKNNLQRAERALNTLQNKQGNMTPGQKQRLLNEYDQALRKMQQGGMQPNQKLLQQLQNLNPQQLNNLTPEQIDQIRENMRRHAQGLDPNGQSKQPGENNDDWMNDGEGEDGEDGEGPGRGGINRGPGTAPRVLGKSHEDTGTGKHQGLQSDDIRNALPGDLLQTSDVQHNLDQTPRAPSAGGTSSGKGQGGDRVWKNSLMPNEKKALKRFFE